MKRSVLFMILFFFLAAPFTDAQLWRYKRWEAAAGGGASFFFGDVGGYSRSENLLGFRDLTYRQTMFDVNANVKYRITRTLNVRTSFTYGLLHGIDERGSNEGRDFEATTTIFEPALLFEYYFIKNKSENSYLFLRGRKGFMRLITSLDFYAFAGAGGVNYNVKVNDNLAARGLPTNGFSLVIPAGLGATLIYTPNINFGVELGRRYAFTDYLDGYTSQFSSANDVYYFLNFLVTYKLKNGPKGWPSFR
ncbi:MAG: hypothetical protein R6W81_07090 [Bacteroidales bacterium]